MALCSSLFSVRKDANKLKKKKIDIELHQKITKLNVPYNLTKFPIKPLRAAPSYVMKLNFVSEQFGTVRPSQLLCEISEKIDNLHFVEIVR
jgi:hypothetical protein